MTIPYNVGIAIYVYNPAYFNKLLQVKAEVEKALLAKYGKEAFTVTRIRESEKYENYSLGIFIVVPEKSEMYTELKEVKESASGNI